jgi:hypothetical protein
MYGLSSKHELYKAFKKKRNNTCKGRGEKDWMGRGMTFHALVKTMLLPLAAASFVSPQTAADTVWIFSDYTNK